MKYVLYAAILVSLALSAAAGSDGSITICTTVVDHEGSVVQEPVHIVLPEVSPYDTQRHPQQGFVSGTITLGTYSSDLLFNDGISDAYCIRRSNLAFGGYFYGQPTSSSEGVDEIIINDQHTMVVNDLSDYQPFEPRIFDSDPNNDAGNSNYDGHIVLYDDSQHRVLAVLVRLKEPMDDGNQTDGNQTDDGDDGNQTDDGDDNGDNGNQTDDGDGDDNGDNGTNGGLNGGVDDADNDRFTLRAFPETECVAPGEEFSMYTSVKYRSETLRDVQVKLFIEELSEYATSSEFSLREDPQYRPLSVYIPRSADTGWYNARVTANARDQQRIVEWRSFLVSNSC